LDQMCSTCRRTCCVSWIARRCTYQGIDSCG